MIDDYAILLDHLETNGPLVALAGSRIHPALSVPPEGWKPGDGALIAFMRRGGLVPMDERGRAISVSYQFKCYGGGANLYAQKISAEGLYRALYDALAFTTSGTILGAQPEGTAGSLEEPDADANWPFMLAFFRVQFRKIS